MKGFINFDITVSKDGDNYQIKGKYEQGGEKTDTQKNPPDENLTEITKLKAYLAGEDDKLDYQTAKDAGAALFKWLFTQRILLLFSASRENARGQGKGVRLRLSLDESLRHLPWEYCYDSELFTDFVVLNRRSPLVRYIDVGIIPDRLELDRAARLLLAYSVDPDDADAVQAAEAELTVIKKELSGLERQKAVIIEDAGQVNLSQLQSRLVGFKPDMLHLVAASKVEGSAKLIMLNDAGRPMVVDREPMMSLFRNTVKAIILSAPPSQDADNDAGLALAEALVQAEVPGVIALHRKMPTQVAGRFAAQFYRFLASLNSLDLAVTEMRINVQLYDKIAWGIPAVFMRAPDGRLWQEGVPEAQGPRPGAPAPGIAPAPFGAGYPAPYQQYDPYSPFMQLNFNNHENGFVSFLSTVKIGGCLVRGHPEDFSALGLNLLMKRLFARVYSQGIQPKKIDFPLRSRNLDNGAADLWNRLARRLDISNFEETNDKAAVVKSLAQELTRNHVFFIFRDVERDTFDSLIKGFWRPLVGILMDPKQSLLEQGRFRLLAFFMDTEGEVTAQSAENIIEIVVKDGNAVQPEDGWPDETDSCFFAIPAVSDFTSADLEEWFAVPVMQPILNQLGTDRLAAAQKTLAASKNGQPDLVLEELIKTQQMITAYDLYRWLEHW